MIEPLVVRTLWGNHVRVRQGFFSDESISGAGIDFLESDPRHVRDMESLSREDAACLGLALCDLAQAGLSPQASAEVMEEGLTRLAASRGHLVSSPVRILPRAPNPTSGAADPPSSSAPGGPAGGILAPPPAGIPLKAEGGRLKAEEGLLESWSVTRYENDTPVWHAVFTDFVEAKETYARCMQDDGPARVELKQHFDGGGEAVKVAAFLLPGAEPPAL